MKDRKWYLVHSAVPIVDNRLKKVYPFIPKSQEVLMAALKLKWKFKRDKRGKYRWQAIASNGLIVGASTQGYAKRKDCIYNAEVFGYKK